MTQNKIDKSPHTIQTMFNIIADKYDLINNIMSLGAHKYIKYKSIKNLDIKPNAKVIDLCCGTGDLCNIVKKLHPDSNVTGIDFSDNMLEIARQKNVNNKILYFQGDVTNLPYEDNSFDTVTMAFGLRNIANPEKAVEEVYRILKPQGKFLHIDFGEKNCLSRIYNIFTKITSKILTENNSAYEYLIQSKNIFPSPEDLIKDFERKGFIREKRQDYLFGVISSQIMTK